LGSGRPGLKAAVVFRNYAGVETPASLRVDAGVEWAAENGWFSDRIPEKHASGAKARAYSYGAAEAALFQSIGLIRQTPRRG
jgi:hypothetical protein